METIDVRRDKADDSYVMVGICGNCMSRFEMLFSKGVEKRTMHKCPDCGVLARFDISKTPKGQRWLLVPEGMQFGCPKCGTFWPMPVGLDVNAEPGDQVIFCPDCIKAEKEKQDAINQLEIKD